MHPTELGSPVTVNSNSTSSSNPNRRLLAIYGKAYLESIGGLVVLHVNGSPYEMGYQNGFLLEAAHKAMIDHSIQKMIDDGYSYEYQVSCSQAMEPHIPQEYIQEMQGLADGAGVNYTDVLLMHTNVDMQMYGTGWTGCSGFAVFGNATIDGHLYHGRNLDWTLPSQPVGLVTVHEPESGNAFVNVGLFGYIGVFSGMNKRGISLGTKLSNSSDKTLDGMPIRFLLRQVLQYSNSLTEAINIIHQTNRTAGWNVLLGDGSSLNACAVEISDNYCEVFWAGDPAGDISPHYSIEDAVRRTNHFVDIELAATQRSPYDPRDGWDWSWSRYEKLSEIILGNYSNIDSNLSIQFLQTYPVGGLLANLQSVVFDATDLELWVANANSTTPAYLREYIHLSCDDLFPTSVSWEVPYFARNVALNYSSSFNDTNPKFRTYSLSSTFNRTFSSPDANGIVNLTMPKESASVQFWFDPISNVTNEVVVTSDGYGKLYTLNNTGDVDIKSMTNDTGMFFWKDGAWHPGGEEWIGDGTPDPAGSSWMTITYNVSVYWGNGTNGPLLGRFPRQSWYTTGFSENTVIEPASRLNGLYVNATGVPYSSHGGIVTYVFTQAYLNTPIYGGPLDVQSKEIMITAPRPAFIATTFPSPNLYIIDPINRPIGTDPITRELVNEILGAFYSGPGSDPQRIVIPNPLDGVYDIGLMGTSTETYTLVVELATVEKTTTHTYTGGIATGQILESEANISEGEMTFTSPSTPVGGIYIPVDKLELLAPYIGLTMLLAAAAVTAVYVKKRKRHTEIFS